MVAADQNNVKRSNNTRNTITTTRGKNDGSGTRSTRVKPRRRTSNGGPQSPPSHDDDNDEDVTALYNILENAMMSLPIITSQDGTTEGSGNDDKGNSGDGGTNNNNNGNNNNNQPRNKVANRTRRDILTQCWDDIRAWLISESQSSSDAQTVKRRQQTSVQYTGQFLTTPLHLACKLSSPPTDIIQKLINCSTTVASWADSQGWLPLHHACANGASRAVVDILIRAYPQGKICQDKRCRTPLHFAFFNSNYNNNHENTITANQGCGGVDNDDDDDSDDVVLGNTLPEIVRLLSDTGAAELPDEGGMIPLHYAAAYGTTRQVLEVLLEVSPNSLNKTENKGRNPLHLAMVNAHRQLSPSVVGCLLELQTKYCNNNNNSTTTTTITNITVDDTMINNYDDDNHLPIHLLALSSKFPPEKVNERSNATKCLILYLAAKPNASTDFLTAIQTLPEWLHDIAVISDHIQEVLDERIVMRFPTMILILDLTFLLLVIVMFEISSIQTIDYLFTLDGGGFDSSSSSSSNEIANTRPSDTPVIIVLVCGGYFTLRTILQIISHIGMGNTSSYIWELDNWLDLLNIFFIYYFGCIMLTAEPIVSMEAFCCGVAITKGIMWMCVINFLKSTQVEFSVFVSGVFYVVQRLAAFLLALLVILLMFAQMFYIVYAKTTMCACTEENTDANPFPHCSFFSSLLKVFTMMMGEIGNAMRYSTLPVAQLLYVVFSFLVVILLSNVLIAIVTDSYGVIKNERAAMVFWSNRLDFVTEIDQIKNVGKLFRKCFGAKKDPMKSDSVKKLGGGGVGGGEDADIFRIGWKSLMNLYDPNLHESHGSISSFDFWCYLLLQLVVGVFVIPMWLILGLATAGWLWPPQVREYLLKQKKVVVSRADMSEAVTKKMTDLQNEILKLRVNMRGEMKNDRREFLQVKAEVEAIQAEVMADLLQMKEIMVILLEMSKDHLGSRK